MSEPEFVTLQVEDGVGTIRLDRPKMNAINDQLHREVRAAALEAGKNTDVGAVVPSGGGRGVAPRAAPQGEGHPPGPRGGARGRRVPHPFTQGAGPPPP